MPQYKLQHCFPRSHILSSLKRVVLNNTVASAQEFFYCSFYLLFLKKEQDRHIKEGVKLPFQTGLKSKPSINSSGCLESSPEPQLETPLNKKSCYD